MPRRLAALVNHANQMAREFRASHVELRHRSRQLDGVPYRQHKLAFVRELPATVDDLWKRHGPQGPQPGPQGAEGTPASFRRAAESWSTTSTRSLRGTCATWARRSIRSACSSKRCESLSPNARVFVVRLDTATGGRGGRDPVSGSDDGAVGVVAPGVPPPVPEHAALLGDAGARDRGWA